MSASSCRHGTCRNSERLSGPDQPRIRARQIYDALYRQQVSDLVQISNSARSACASELAGSMRLGLPEVEQLLRSVGRHPPLPARLADGRTVETVLMPEGERDTICISSQVGCPVDCKFCMTALMGLERNLTAGEIVGQVLFVARDNGLLRTTRRLNIVMMGHGRAAAEPAERAEGDPHSARSGASALSPRRITVSTSGIIPKIAELGREPVRPKLAISLNASTEEQRRELMPITRKYHLKDLMEACRAYPLRPWEKLTFEYVLLRA